MLRTNLIDTLNDLKTSEKENELIFAEKLKLQKQIGDDASLGSLCMQGSENDRDGIIGKVISNEPEIEEKKEQIGGDDNQRGYLYSDEIKADNEFYQANSKLIDNTDDMIQKYNNMIISNIETAKSITPPPTSGSGYTSHMPSGVSNLHKINEIDVEGDAKLKKSIIEMSSTKPKSIK